MKTLGEPSAKISRGFTNSASPTTTPQPGSESRMQSISWLYANFFRDLQTSLQKAPALFDFVWSILDSNGLQLEISSQRNRAISHHLVTRLTRLSTCELTSLQTKLEICFHSNRFFSRFSLFGSCLAIADRISSEILVVEIYFIWLRGS